MLREKPSRNSNELDDRPPRWSVTVANENAGTLSRSAGASGGIVAAAVIPWEPYRTQSGWFVFTRLLFPNSEKSFRNVFLGKVGVKLCSSMKVKNQSAFREWSMDINSDNRGFSSRVPILITFPALVSIIIFLFGSPWSFALSSKHGHPLNEDS